MKNRMLCGFVLSLSPILARAEMQGDLPTAFPPARYAEMIKKSPFALATVTAPPVQQTPPFAANLYVTGIAKIGETDFVSISSRDQQTAKFSLLSGETGANDISLVSIEWSEQIGKSKVTLKKGSEFAVLEFDQIAIMQTPNQPPLPIMGGAIPPAPQAGESGRRIILPNQPNPGTPPTVPRQRVRIINNKP